MILCPECHEKVHETKAKRAKKISKNRKIKKQKVNKYGLKVIKEKSANKIIKEAKNNPFYRECVHCVSAENCEFTWCDLGYKYCPYNQCADYKSKENKQ